MHRFIAKLCNDFCITHTSVCWIYSISIIPSTRFLWQTHLWLCEFSWFKPQFPCPYFLWTRMHTHITYHILSAPTPKNASDSIFSVIWFYYLNGLLNSVGNYSLLITFLKSLDDVRVVLRWFYFQCVYNSGKGVHLLNDVSVLLKLF